MTARRTCSKCGALLTAREAGADRCFDCRGRGPGMRANGVVFERSLGLSRFNGPKWGEDDDDDEEDGD